MRKRDKKKYIMASGCDPLGSYTGICPDGSEPTQDADDL